KYMQYPARNPRQTLRAQDDHVIEAFASETSQESPANRVGVRRCYRNGKDSHSHRVGHCVERRAEVVVVVQMRRCGPSFQAVGSRSCCLTHALVDERVTAECMRRRESSSIKKNSKIGRKGRS